MINLLSIFVLICPFTILGLSLDLPEFTCLQAGSICSLYNVHLTYENFRYQIKAEDPVYVQSVVFELSTIPYFTALDLCTIFTYLFELRAEKVGIEEIDSNAIEKCQYLTTLELNDNRIKVIPSTLFTRPYPQFVQLANNLITQIKTETFASLELELFNIAGNNLNIFPVNAFKNAQFQWLFLQSNLLVDLDVDELIRKFPRLIEGRLIYGGNNIACSRMEEINRMLRRANITYNPIDGFDHYYPKVKYYAEDKVEELPCVPDKSYASMFYKNKFLFNQKLRKVTNSYQNSDFKQNFENTVEELEHTIKSFKDEATG